MSSFLDFLTSGNKVDVLNKQQTTLTLKDIVSPAAIKIEHNTINISGAYSRTFFVISYPKLLNDSWLAPLINLDKVFDVSIFVYPIDSATILKTFERKVAEVESQILTRNEQGKVRDPKLSTSFRMYIF
jgi:hypothetical protein